MVDELRTFDGRQDIDLAYLIRRLRVPRQESPGKGLICVGTSATVGDEGNSAELRQYAADVFGQAFDEHTILREERQSIDELLGTAIIQTHIAPQPNLAERVDPAPRYGDAESYLKAQHELFFGTPIEGDFHAVDWCIALAEKLRGHLMFVNLLRTLVAGPLPLPPTIARTSGSVLPAVCPTLSVCSYATLSVLVSSPRSPRTQRSELRSALSSRTAECS